MLKFKVTFVHLNGNQLLNKGHSYVSVLINNNMDITLVTKEITKKVKRDQRFNSV